ncbi:MAG: PEP-CTERM sorting domain-containing protein [Armatimonadetes bacterium]|nr:PEP-CTERM sorting domain-containing protein [Akkermansiaceae bacterium]
MKTKIPLFAALYCGLCTVGSAFTLDFADYVGVSLPPNPLTIPIAGYGSVTFDAGTGSSLIVDSAYLNDNGFGAPSLSFNQNEAVKVTFNNAPPLNVDFDFVGVSAGEAFVVQPDLFTPQSFIVNLQGGGDGAGIYSISWNQVPEPTASLLGALGGAFLVIRRRR